MRGFVVFSAVSVFACSPYRQQLKADFVESPDTSHPGLNRAVVALHIAPITLFPRPLAGRRAAALLFDPRALTWAYSGGEGRHPVCAGESVVPFFFSPRQDIASREVGLKDGRRAKFYFFPPGQREVSLYFICPER